jgi:hypothetical protein
MTVVLVACLVEDRRRLLYALDAVPGVEIVGGAFSVASAASCIATHDPDVVVTTGDVALPELRSPRRGSVIPVVVMGPYGPNHVDQAITPAIGALASLIRAAGPGGSPGPAAVTRGTQVLVDRQGQTDV